MYTVYNILSEDWKITKKALRVLGINPEKPWDDITVSELGNIADHFDIRIADLF